MPLMMPPFQAPSAAVATLPEAPSLADAEQSVFAALDADAPLPPPVQVASGARAYAWLRAAARWKTGSGLPANPFAKGTREAEEADAVRGFLASDSGAARLPLKLSGSRLLLWTWMRSRDRTAPLPRAERAAIEDRLLDGGPDILQGWALRHALCFAIAERDNARFAALKRAKGSEAPDTFVGVQSLLGLVGGPSPVFRLWQLPDLRYQDATLGELGARRVWICPPGFPVPPGAAWIIPSATGDQNGRETGLDLNMKAEAEALLPALKGRAAWFAASRGDWEAAGLAWFPILIELDKDGNLASVKMGDAAP
ncbi:MAG TPA: hypothetical protein VFF76_06640 [Holophagaceae bacterium]|nr:hypothetical protein [Holophagaceae bacterium]